MAKSKIALLTSAGKIVLELFDEQAPKTVANFLSYIQDNFYNGTIFHRVIEGFMIQGGGLDINLQPKQTKPPIDNEAKSELKNEKFTLAMARTAEPHSATSQFFINVADNHFLNQPQEGGWGYAVFGKVIEGEDIVLQISQTETAAVAGYTDVPIKTVTIDKAEILS